MKKTWYSKAADHVNRYCKNKKIKKHLKFKSKICHLIYWCFISCSNYYSSKLKQQIESWREIKTHFKLFKLIVGLLFCCFVPPYSDGFYSSSSHPQVISLISSFEASWSVLISCAIIWCRVTRHCLLHQHCHCH